MTTAISLKCQCGSFKGVATVSRSFSRRIVCLCDDCQAYAHFLGKAKSVLDANGGTDVCPVTPAHIKVTHRAENLRCLRLSPRGMYRWYAGCCKTPIANSLPSYRVPFAGVVHTIMDHAGDHQTREEALGPIFARVQGKFGIAPLPPGTLQKASLSVILSTLKFLLSAVVKREYKPSPFFDTVTGKPRVEPYILTLAERESMRKLCGPRPQL